MHVNSQFSISSFFLNYISNGICTCTIFIFSSRLSKLKSCKVFNRHCWFSQCTVNSTSRSKWKFPCMTLRSAHVFSCANIQNRLHIIFSFSISTVNIHISTAPPTSGNSEFVRFTVALLNFTITITFFGYFMPHYIARIVIIQLCSIH